MKQAYVSSWNASTQPRKQRKYLWNAPAHVRTSFLSSHLSKELREKHKIRSLPVRKGDRIKVLRGQFAGTIGKITNVLRDDVRVHIEGVELVKADSSKKPYPVHPSNILILELVTTDKRRIGPKTKK
jgi:large subunit ribosomal protein L24